MDLAMLGSTLTCDSFLGPRASASPAVLALLKAPTRGFLLGDSGLFFFKDSMRLRVASLESCNQAYMVQKRRNLSFSLGIFNAPHQEMDDVLPLHVTLSFTLEAEGVGLLHLHLRLCNQS